MKPPRRLKKFVFFHKDPKPSLLDECRRQFTASSPPVKKLVPLTANLTPVDSKSKTKHHLQTLEKSIAEDVAKKLPPGLRIIELEDTPLRNETSVKMGS
jgi:hypothetical protein